MSRGYPDYFGESTFFKFGAYTEHTQQNNTINNAVRADVFNIAAKARVYGLYIYVSGIGAMDGLDIITTIDGDELETIVADTLLARQYGQLGGYHIKLSLYDPDAGVITIVGAHEITFDLSFQLELDNDTGGQIFVTGSMHYAHVQ